LNKKTYESLSEDQITYGSNSVGHYGLRGWLGVAGGERVPPAPLEWYTSMSRVEPGQIDLL